MIAPADATSFWTMVQALAVTITLILILRQIKAQVGQLEVQAEQLKVQADQLKLQTEDLNAQTQQVRAQRLTNMLSSISSINQTWDSPAMRDARRGVCQDYLETKHDIEGFSSRVLLHHFEELGAFYKHGLYEAEVLWSIFSETIRWYWLICEEKIRTHRQEKGDETFYECFESLKNAMETHSIERGLKLGTETDVEIRAFVESQMRFIEDGKAQTK